MSMIDRYDVLLFWSYGRYYRVNTNLNLFTARFMVRPMALNTGGLKTDVYLATYPKRAGISYKVC